jgi:excisionase family DNA binding protein
MGKLLCSKKETADALGVSLRTIDNLIAGKELIIRRVGRRVLVPMTEIQRFTRRDHPTQPNTKEPAALADSV